MFFFILAVTLRPQKEKPLTINKMIQIHPQFSHQIPFSQRALIHRYSEYAKIQLTQSPNTFVDVGFPVYIAKKSP